MNRLATLLISSAFCAAAAAAQSSTPGTPTSAGSRPEAASAATAGTAITTTLTKALDSKKLKQGDLVTARTVDPVKKDGQTVIPSGSTIQGHVTSASSKQSGDTYSSLGIVFDKAVLKNGEQIPLKAALQAIAAPQEQINAPNAAAETTPVGGGAPQGGGMSQPGRPSTMPSVPTAPQTAETNDTGQSTAAGLNGNGRLTPTSRGIYGLNGISVKESMQDNQQVALFTSTNKTVHLDSGTQLLLVAQL
jgi:hypothetical protein